jgi:hypothetical protein
MSESIARRIWKTDRKHKNSVRLVLLALAECIDSGNSCPAIADLADMAQVTQTSVRHALAELETDKTITIQKQAGRSEKGGRTNCYAVNSSSDSPSDAVPNDPAKVLEGTKDLPLNPLEGTKLLEGGNLAPDPAKVLEGATPAEYVRGDVREDKELKEQKEFENNPTNSLKVIVPDAPVNVPSQTEDDLKRNFDSKEPDLQAFASKAMTAAMSDQNAPNPGSGDPLPPAVKREYLDYFGKTAVVDKEQVALLALVEKHGHDGLIAFIKVAPKVDGKTEVIRNPACYMLTMTPAEQKSAHSQKQKFVSRTHLQGGSDLKPAKEYPDEMQFEPPDIKTAAPKGALAAWS